MEKIKFSVLIPVYNCENYLANCVESVLNQDYENVEIILADDGSTDRTVEICDSFNDERVKVYHKENEGPLMTRVFAFSKATGDYCLFIDCDDYVDKGYLNRLSEIIKKEKCDMVVCSFRRVSEDEVTEAATPWTEEKVFSKKEMDTFRKEFLLNNYLNSMCTKTIRTEILKADTTDFSQFAQYKHGEDLIQSLYPVFNSKKAVYIPECWYNYRVNDASITHTAKPDRYKSILAAREQAFSYLKNSSFYNEETHCRYAALVVKSLMSCAKSIIKADIPQTEKVALFDDINDNDFYNELVASYDDSFLDTKTKVVYKLFKIRSYKTVISLISHFSR